MSITGLNLINLRIFSKLEFWFALVKVVAVVGMIVFGTVLTVSGPGREATAVSNLWQHGGFLPNGVTGLLRSLVMFSFGGTKLIGIAAGKVDDPKTRIPKVIRQVMWRILILYVGALTVMMILFPSACMLVMLHIGFGLRQRMAARVPS